MLDILIIAMGYLLGGISTGYYLVRMLRRQDIRNYGSGATGATNVGRMLGAIGFVLTFLGDVFKGCLIPAIAIYIELSEITVMLGLIAVVAGHVWPLQLEFRGGKGVATAFGGIAVIDPQLALILFMIAMGLLITRKITLSGLLVIVVSPIITFLMSRSINQVIGILIVTMILLIAHRRNITMILNEVLMRRN